MVPFVNVSNAKGANPAFGEPAANVTKPDPHRCGPGFGVFAYACAGAEGFAAVAFLRG
jgi:hypothetical protein